MGDFLPGLFVNPAEVDHAHEVLTRNPLAVHAGQQVEDVLGLPEFGVLTFNFPGAEFGDRLELDPVNYGRIELLSSAESLADGNPNNFALSVLVALIPEANGHGLSVVSKDVEVEVGVEVKRVHGVTKGLFGANCRCSYTILARNPLSEHKWENKIRQKQSIPTG